MLPRMATPTRGPGGSSKPRRGRSKDVETGRVRVHDPFELIRWLALSQPDPRKALAELVQNSLDAGAKKVRITRVRRKGVPCLEIRDDGEGVIPELDRNEALRYIATHVGHSRKRSLSPQQRLELMTQGQYGIGLLGFWTLGDALEIRSSVPGQKPYRLILYRDRDKFVIEPMRGKLAFDERWTEVVVVGLNKDASTAVTARRASDYLASELRGQLLERDVEVVVEDRIARGRSAKSMVVRPPLFLGTRLEGLGPLEVRGYASIRLDVYLVGDDSDDDGDAVKPLALYSSGTLVAGSFEELAALGLDHAPWTDRRLTGLVEFPQLQIAPGSRRGVVLDAVAHEFAAALVEKEPVLMGILEARERERVETLEKNMVRDLQRALRDFYRQRPRYTMLPTRTDAVTGDGDAVQEGEAMPGVHARADEDSESQELTGDETTEPASLFPPGPLEGIVVVPARVRLEVNAQRKMRAVAVDTDGRAVEAPVTFVWELFGDTGTVDANDDTDSRALFTAGTVAAEGILSVTARSNGTETSTAVPVEVVEHLPAATPDEGIPEPELVDQPSARPALKLRYLALLFSKEVVVRSTRDPRLGEPLEQMVEVAAYADRQLTERPPRGRRRTKR